MNAIVEHSKKVVASRLAGLESASGPDILDRLRMFESGLDAGVRELRRRASKESCDAMIVHMEAVTTLLRRYRATLGD